MEWTVEEGAGLWEGENTAPALLHTVNLKDTV